jgi:hypothetical protein
MVDGGRSMVVSDYIAGDGVMVCRAPQRPAEPPTSRLATCATKSVYEPSPIKDVSNVGTGDFEITLSKPEDLERAMPLLKHNYEDS